MNITMHLAVVAAVCLCLAEGAPEVRVARAKQRPTRGFKNVEMMTARGFGKRDRLNTRAEHDFEVPARKTYNPKSSLMVASDFGKRNGNDADGEDYDIRVARGFKPGPKVLIARGYGKRDNSDEDSEIRITRNKFKSNPKILIARGYGKREESESEVYGLDNFWEMLEASPEREGQDGNENKVLESIPLDWFVNEMLNNPDFTRSVVRKFVDINQDGQLTSDELLRNVV